MKTSSNHQTSTSFYGETMDTITFSAYFSKWSSPTIEGTFSKTEGDTHISVSLNGMEKDVAERVGDTHISVSLNGMEKDVAERVIEKLQKAVEAWDKWEAEEKEKTEEEKSA